MSWIGQTPRVGDLFSNLLLVFNFMAQLFYVMLMIRWYELHIPEFE